MRQRAFGHARTAIAYQHLHLGVRGVGHDLDRSLGIRGIGIARASARYRIMGLTISNENYYHLHMNEPEQSPGRTRSLSIAAAVAPEPAAKVSVRMVQRTTIAALLDGASELIIEHAGREYRLRLTQNGKLILTA